MFFALPCIAFWTGVVAGLMFANFVWEERSNTKKQPRYGGDGRYLPDSKIKPYKKSADMLKPSDDG